jgi:hypothetical protein
MCGHMVRRWGRAGLLAGALALAAAGTELKRETLAAFERHVKQVEPGIELQVMNGDGFLFATTPERRASLRAGNILTEPKIRRGELKVSSGLIHDWAGAVFIRDVSVRQVIEMVQAYDRHKQFYQPEVLDSRLLAHDGEDFRVALRLLKKKVLTVVLATEHEVHYEQRDATRWWSRSRSTRISEIENPGTRSERVLPPDTGNGFLWRLNSYWTFQELDGGTYVECEAISLTRDVPAALRLLINDIVRTLPRESLTNTLRNTRTGVLRLNGN